MNETEGKTKADFGGICHSTLPFFAASLDVKANFRVVLPCRCSRKTSLGE